MPVALITGASRGLGLETARALAARDWQLVLDARGADDLLRAAAALPGRPSVALPGDVTDPAHRARLVDAVAAHGRLDVLVNNASVLGPDRLAPLATTDLADVERAFAVNTFAPLALVQAVLPQLRAAGGAVVDISSDAAVEAYPTWGAYGAAKAALDHLSAVLAEEEPQLRVYAVDPGDMRTRLQQQAFPDEDISDRPLPEQVVPALLRLLDERPASGRYRASELLVTA